MKTLYELYESRFCKEIGRKIVGEQRDEVRRSIFEASRGGAQAAFWVMKKTIEWLNVLKNSMCV